MMILLRRILLAAVHPDAALDLDQHTSLHMSKIGPPTPLVMEAAFPLQGGAIRGFPEHQEAILQTGGRTGGTVAQAGHGLRGESTKRTGVQNAAFSEF